MEFRLRRAVAEDKQAINALFVEMLRTIHGKEDVESYREGDLDGYFSGGENWICVAEVDESVVGFLSIEVHREDENYLYYDDFCVSGDYRAKGIGTALMHAAEEYCCGLRFGNVVLHVEKSNRSAREFYARKGFVFLRDDGTRLCLIKHFPVPDVKPDVSFAEAVERIRRMEHCFDEMTKAAKEHAAVPEALRKTLTDYYAGGLWLCDYRLDEMGYFPAELKRGVLSEDAVYNLLGEIERNDS